MDFLILNPTFISRKYPAWSWYLISWRDVDFCLLMLCLLFLRWYVWATLVCSSLCSRRLIYQRWYMLRRRSWGSSFLLGAQEWSLCRAPEWSDLWDWVESPVELAGPGAFSGLFARNPVSFFCGASSVEACGNAGSLTHWARPGIEPTITLKILTFPAVILNKQAFPGRVRELSLISCLVAFGGIWTQN